MSDDMTVAEYKERMYAVERKENRKGLVAHAVVVTMVGLLLATVNMLLMPEFVWFVFPAVGMSAGVALHYLFAILLYDRDVRRREHMIEALDR